MSAADDVKAAGHTHRFGAANSEEWRQAVLAKDPVAPAELSRLRGCLAMLAENPEKALNGRPPEEWAAETLALFSAIVTDRISES